MSKSKTYRPWSPRQAYLLPPTLQEWLPKGHLAYFILDVVGELDLSQITAHYAPETLIGRQVVAAVNLGERRIAGFKSQVLVLGGMPSATEVVLLRPDHPLENGTRIG